MGWCEQPTEPAEAALLLCDLWRDAKSSRHLASFFQGEVHRGTPPTFASHVPIVPATKPTLRHCLYHCYPSRANDTWRANVEQLLRRVRVFNGQKVVAIALDDTTWDYATAAEPFRQAGFTCLRHANDERLREVATFLPLLLHVASVDPREAVFYAHTKGNSTSENARGAMYWRNVAYRELLDGWRRRMRNLKHHAAIGVHKIVWTPTDAPPYPSGLRHGLWMLAGTFFWFRSACVFSHPEWRYVPPDRYGAEAYLSGLLPSHLAKSVYQLWPEDVYPTPTPYDPDLYPPQDRLED